MPNQYMDNIKKARESLAQKKQPKVNDRRLVTTLGTPVNTGNSPKVNDKPLITRTTPGKTPAVVRKATPVTPKKPITASPIKGNTGKANLRTKGGAATTPGFKPGTINQKKY